MTITNDIKYVGVNDHDVDLFEGQYDVPNGMAYNSYVILDDKIAVMDTVEEDFGDEWLANIAAVLEGKKPDYLVISHMEPDHSANIKSFLEVYPDATVVGNAKIFTMMSQFFGGDITANKLTVSDKETLCLGKHTLQFIFAAMVHWPEVMVSYDSTDKVLFSADAFGKFGALDVEEDWDCEARRYYFGIVGKYGMMVQKLLKEVATLDVATVCPLHGPILTENLGHYIGQYDTWSSYRPENEGVFIAYASAHGNTKKAAQMLAAKLEAQGCPKVAISDLAREDMAECVEDAFRYDRLVLASITYNAGIFPCMKTFIDALTERGYQNRKIGFIENGSWAPMAKKIMQGMFEKSKNITFCEESVTIQSAVNAETEAAIDRLAKELLNTAAAQPEE